MKYANAMTANNNTTNNTTNNYNTNNNTTNNYNTGNYNTTTNNNDNRVIYERPCGKYRCSTTSYDRPRTNPDVMQTAMEDTGKETGRDDAVQTGDDSFGTGVICLMAGLMAAALAGMITLIIRSRREEEEDPMPQYYRYY